PSQNGCAGAQGRRRLVWNASPLCHDHAFGTRSARPSEPSCPPEQAHSSEASPASLVATFAQGAQRGIRQRTECRNGGSWEPVQSVRPTGSRLSCGRPPRRRESGGRVSLCPLGHDTTASFRTRAPGSFKRMLGGILHDIDREWPTRQAMHELDVIPPTSNSNGELFASDSNESLMLGVVQHDLLNPRWHKRPRNQL